MFESASSQLSNAFRFIKNGSIYRFVGAIRNSSVGKALHPDVDPVLLEVDQEVNPGAERVHRTETVVWRRVIQHSQKEQFVAPAPADQSCSEVVTM